MMGKKCVYCLKEVELNSPLHVCGYCMINHNTQEYNVPIQQGWICPKCGSVYGPSVMECSRCNQPQGVTVTFKGGGV